MTLEENMDVIEYGIGYIDDVGRSMATGGCPEILSRRKIMDNENKGLACVGGIVAIAILLVATIIINGFVLQQLWAWFVTPLGFPAVTLAHALGLSVLLSVFSGSKVAAKTDDLDWPKATLVALAPLPSLALGWVLYQFMYW